jgi:hypothetical protein
MAAGTEKSRKGRRKVVAQATAATPVDVPDEAQETRETAERPDGPSRHAYAHARTDSADAFFSDPEDGPARVSDDLAELLAEDFLRSATSGEDADEETMEQIVDEEYGGPFVETSGREEFASGTDESNPEDADPEPLPRAVHGIIQPPPRLR